LFKYGRKKNFIFSTFLLKCKKSTLLGAFSDICRKVKCSKVGKCGLVTIKGGTKYFTPNHRLKMTVFLPFTRLFASLHTKTLDTNY
jgi:hypothetical protein